MFNLPYKVIIHFSTELRVPETRISGTRSTTNIFCRLSKQELSSFRIGRHQQINLEIDMDEKYRKHMKLMDGSMMGTDEQQSDTTEDEDQGDTGGLLSKSENLSTSEFAHTR